MEQNTSNLANYIWKIADLLRGDFKRSQYGRIILPFTLLRRLEGVLEEDKDTTIQLYKSLQDQQTGTGEKLAESAIEKIILTQKRISFFNKSQMNLSKLGETGIKDNLESYIQDFSTDAREIFEYFNFSEFIAQLNDANLLYIIIKEVRKFDLSPKAVSDYEMGLVFEELIRKFAESSNETAGEHFTPRDIVELTTSLIFCHDDEVLSKDGIIRTFYDPTAGTGGFLSSGMEYVNKLNPKAIIRSFGQELNPESYAICKADMLIKGQDVSNVKLGNTLSNDQLYTNKFDYMISNPPFGVDWKKVEKEIKEEQKKGEKGRFAPGLPRVSDGALLFLLHLISKMRDASEGGARIGIILNGSPLFTGGAGSGESEIRRYILESDLLEAIVALPTDMFYNTGIATYIWVLSNDKEEERKGKVQLINAVNLYKKRTKPLGDKRNYVTDENIKKITRCFGNFEIINNEIVDVESSVKSNRGRQSTSTKIEAPKTFGSKIFNTHEFGYRRITVERPLRQSYQFSDKRINSLKFLSTALKTPMEYIYDNYCSDWNEESYGEFSRETEEKIRLAFKSEFSELKEKQIKKLLNKGTWTTQKKILQKAKELQNIIGTEQVDDVNELEKTIKETGVRLETAEKKQIIATVTWTNPEAAKVVKKIHKKESDSMYGLFENNGQTVEYKPDSELRDYENIPLDPTREVQELIESYFKKEVLPHVPEAWIDSKKRDDKDGELGVVGYEIPFNRHFYIYQPPRSLEEIDADLKIINEEIIEMFKEMKL